MNLIDKTVGNYKIIKSLGRGSQAEVYLAEPLNKIPNITLPQNKVALKILNLVYSNDSLVVQRFFNEIQAITTLKHRHIISIYEIDSAIVEGNQIYFYAMRYVSGGTLESRMQSGRLSMRHIDQILAQVASGLDEAHKHNIIHRDIKPSNILISQDDGVLRAFLTDFGVAKLVGRKTLTQDGQTLIGTPNYMSPEQIKGISLDRRADIYSLGVMMFEMVTGRLPYEDAINAQPVLFYQVHTLFPSVKTMDSKLPSSLDPIIQKATAKDPKGRYKDAYLLANEFHTTLINPTTVPKNNSRVLLYAALLLLVILSTAFSLVWWGGSQQVVADGPIGVTQAVVGSPDTPLDSRDSRTRSTTQVDPTSTIDARPATSTSQPIAAAETVETDPEDEGSDNEESLATEESDVTQSQDQFSITSPVGNKLDGGGNTEDGSGEYKIRWEGKDLRGLDDQFFAMVIMTPDRRNIIVFTGHQELERRVNFSEHLANEPNGDGYSFKIIHYSGNSNVLGNAISESEERPFTWAPN